ncbi:hypothetical protein VP01_1792g7 [Puccinia sorghi]|uniref:Uncharacterized protein n=1 Tax=Puccinia sorghi TaxID=27349 RepID=A0A0L6VEH9_9BASI|nr:hypothetical protein VP01_1792g7 [Puccinia sorghi]
MNCLHLFWTASTFEPGRCPYHGFCGHLKPHGSNLYPFISCNTRPRNIPPFGDFHTKGSGSFPQAKSGNVTFCRGKYEEVPDKKDSMANGMLLMMHKASKQSAEMMQEDLRLREEAHLDEKRESKVRLKQV